MTLFLQITTCIIAVIPLVFLVDLLFSSKSFKPKRRTLLNKIYHGIFFLMTAGIAAYISHDWLSEGQGAWSRIQGDTYHYWVLDVAIFDYLEFWSIAIDSATTGFYHAIFFILSKLSHLADISPFNDDFATDITNRVILAMTLTPLVFIALTVIRRVVFQVQKYLCNNRYLVDKLTIKYEASGWIKAEAVATGFVLFLLEVFMTFSASLFTVLIAAPMIVNSSVVAGITVGGFYFFRSVLKVRQGRRALPL